MRKDLAKCTTERERGGSRNPSKKWGGKIRPDENFDNYFGGFHPWGRHRYDDYGKSLSDVLRPLRGNIRKYLGRPWDEFYHDFCELFDRRSMDGYHMHTHLRWEIKEKTFVGHDGYVYSIGERGQIEPIDSYDGFYVDPVSRLICDAGSFKRYRWFKTPSDTQLKAHNYNPFIDDASGGYWERQEGIWYHFHTETWTTYFTHRDLAMDGDEVVIVDVGKPYVQHHSKTHKRQIGGTELQEVRKEWADRVAKGLGWEKKAKNSDAWMKGMFRGRV